MQLYNKGGYHILVTAGSNSACDTIALRIIEYIERYAELQGTSNVMLRLLPYTRFKKVKKMMNSKILNIQIFKQWKKENVMYMKVWQK